jgi:hypothetical protein
MLSGCSVIINCIIIIIILFSCSDPLYARCYDIQALLIYLHVYVLVIEIVLVIVYIFSAVFSKTRRLFMNIYFFNVRQKKCNFFNSFAFIKYVIFESVQKR